MMTQRRSVVSVFERVTKEAFGTLLISQHKPHSNIFVITLSDFHCVHSCPTSILLVKNYILNIFFNISIFDLFIIPGVEPTPCECELRIERDMNLGEEGGMFNFVTNFFFKTKSF